MTESNGISNGRGMFDIITLAVLTEPETKPESQPPRYRTVKQDGKLKGWVEHDRQHSRPSKNTNHVATLDLDGPKDCGEVG